MAYKISRYGWLPDSPDHRGLRYGAFAEMVGVAPTRADLRGHCPLIYDQSQLGSCTANAISTAIKFDQMFVVRNSWGGAKMGNGRLLHPALC